MLVLLTTTLDHMQTYPEKQAPTQQYLMTSFVLQYAWGSSKWWKEILSEMWKLDEIPRENERGLKNKYSRTVWRTAGATESIWGKANSKNWSVFLNGEGGGKSLENTMPFESRSGQSFTEHFTLEMWPCTYSEEHFEMWNPLPKWMDPFLQGSDL